MAETATPLTAPIGLTRLGRPAAEAVAGLGPLANLVGTWMGSHGWELIAVPSGTPGEKESFQLIIRPYIEVVTFAELGAPVPDRGGPKGDIFLTGLHYSMRITDAETNSPLHLENGMWLLLDGRGTVARQASIPHGDVLLAIGGSSTAAGPPSIPVLNAIPEPGPDVQLGYTDPYGKPPTGFATDDANATLRTTVEGQTVVSTTTLSVSTANEGGGVLNIPFVQANANATKFACTYWIETVRDATGQEFAQLQYSQQTDIDFLPTFGGPPGSLIMWPHVNVNTLVKQ
ncbi:MAG TPA: heme-binding protein [Actinomycetota bacterium]|nr:heme-binding protein [Actinomycetota bacterium]